MNYIKCLNEAFGSFYNDQRLNPSHISLYMALFQEWNGSRFAVEIYVSRQALMHISKIGSPSTYHRCMSDLNDWGYLTYYPSYNPMKGSRVKMTVFDPALPRDGENDPELEHLAERYRPIDEQVVNSNRPRTEQAVEGNRPNIEQVVDSSHPISEQVVDSNHPINEQLMGCSINTNKQDKHIKQPKDQKTVEIFFSANESNRREGSEFFGYYDENEWKTSNGIPVRDWKALAKSWIRRAASKKEEGHENFGKRDYLKIKKQKDYDQPL